MNALRHHGIGEAGEFVDFGNRFAQARRDAAAIVRCGREQLDVQWTIAQGLDQRDGQQSRWVFAETIR